MSPDFLPTCMVVGTLFFIGCALWYFDAKATRLNKRREQEHKQEELDRMNPDKYKILTNGKGKYAIQFPSGYRTAGCIDSIERANEYIDRYVAVYKETWEKTHQVWTEVDRI